PGGRAGGGAARRDRGGPGRRLRDDDRVVALAVDPDLVVATAADVALRDRVVLTEGPVAQLDAARDGGGVGIRRREGGRPAVEDDERAEAVTDEGVDVGVVEVREKSAAAEA